MGDISKEKEKSATQHEVRVSCKQPW